MADAPSGGSSWGTFEIVLGILLVIAVLSHLGGTKTSTNSSGVSTTLSPVDNSANRCGLSVTAPLSFEKVPIYGSVHLSGSVNGCNWKKNENIALYAQVINGAGVPVSDFVAVPDNGGDFINTAFNTSITLSRAPSVGTGYLILIPAVQDPKKPITVRIPLKFVR